jgi:branched-chain amino acid transport system substrate-binding protein
MVGDTNRHGGQQSKYAHLDSSSRRRFLAAAGVTGIAGLATWPGATTAATQDIGTVNYGILNPLTGPYGGLAEGQRNGAQLAVQHVNDSDEYDFQIEATYEDTEANPSVGRRRAQRVVQQEDAQYLFGAISSSTALALNDFAQRQRIIYNPGAAAVAITGSECNEFVFRAETSAAQIAEAVAPWTIENLGTSVWFHIADYAYGESVLEEWRSRMEATSDDFTEVGVSRSEFGATNYGNYISQIGNSDAEVAVLGMTGGDLINFVGQAAGQGLKDEVQLVSPTMTFQVVRGALGADALDTYGGVRYVPSLETGDNQAFVEAYDEEYDGTPDNFARVAYDSIRMTTQGIQEAGTTDPAQVKDTLAGLEVDSLFGPNQFRACDHQAMNPVWAGQNVEADEGDVAEVELLQEIEGPDAIPACEDTGCQL